MNIFICTHYGDAHAIVVQRVLERAGHRVFRWISEMSTDLQAHRVITSKTIEYQITARGVDAALTDFDVVWWRRQNDIVLPKYVNVGDTKVSLKEWESLYSSIPMFFRADARWINPWYGRTLAKIKLLQLKEALAVGLNTPRTLVSNDASEIRAFAKAQPDGAIHKMFESVSWRDEKNCFRSRTTSVHASHLVDDRVLRLCPGIFQNRVPKAQEIRATFMGERCFAAAINPRDNPEGVCDWRSIPTKEREMWPIDLPAELLDKCRTLMKRLNIVFGCFDFLLTPAGDYIFLEVNETGQFLWVEEQLPEIPMLAFFCEFLTGEPFDFSTNIAKELADPDIKRIWDEEYANLSDRLKKLSAAP